MARRPRMPFPKQVSTVVHECVTGLGLAEKLREAEIWRIWPEVVGEVIAHKAQPLRIINGILTVTVSSAPWMQELRFMTSMMKDKLNTSLGAEVVRDIVLKAGRVDVPVTEKPEEIFTPQPLTPEQCAFIEAQAACIRDAETRQAFLELMQAGIQLSTKS